MHCQVKPYAVLLRVVEADCIDSETIEHVQFQTNPLYNKDFSRCTFRFCDFTSAELGAYEFSDCRFEACNFSNTVLAGSRILDPVFLECKLAGLAFYTLKQLAFTFIARTCTLINCNFSDVQSRKSILTACSIKDSDFVNADFQAADFSGSEFSGCVFHNVNLKKTDFTGAYGYEINPQTNDVRRATFSMPHVVGLLSGLDILIKD